MAATGAITISGSVTGLSTGTKTLVGAITSVAAVGQIVDVVLASGDNTIAVPAGTTAVLIEPPSGNVVALKLKGVGGDTGVLLHKVYPTLLALDPSQTTLIVNAASLTAGATEFSFV